jgi:hypothetical protein
MDKHLDELHGAKFFTNLNLRSNYHQIRMHMWNVEKMMFCMHHRHFGFLIVPTTFQTLMNDMLLPFLHKFVLVFLDDILIYNSSWSKHLQHMSHLQRPTHPQPLPQAVQVHLWCTLDRLSRPRHLHQQCHDGQ